MLAETPDRVVWYLQQVRKLIGSMNEGQASRWNAIAQITLEVIHEREITC